jgi:hypothetical protein
MKKSVNSSCEKFVIDKIAENAFFSNENLGGSRKNGDSAKHCLDSFGVAHKKNDDDFVTAHFVCLVWFVVYSLI